jgi:hypothetical protein
MRENIKLFNGYKNGDVRDLNIWLYITRKIWYDFLIILNIQLCYQKNALYYINIQLFYFDIYIYDDQIRPYWRKILIVECWI